MPSTRQTCFAVLSVFFLILGIFWKDLPRNIPDYKVVMDRVYYLHMAQGHTDKVISPFTKRVLHPKVASLVSGVFGTRIDTAFFIVSLAALMAFIILVALIFRQSALPALLLVPLLVSPYLGLSFFDYYMHDLFFSAFMAFFFWLLLKEKWILALCLIPVLFVVREATLLLSLTMLLLSLFKRNWRLVAGVILATFVGMKFSGYLASLGLPNRHGIGELFYMGGKIFYNTFSNMLGINFWVPGYECTPTRFLALPHWLSAGRIHEIGVCDFKLMQPVHTFYRYFTVFGLLPLVTFFILRRQWREILKSEFWLLLALIYGSLSFVIGPLLGPGGFRLMGYGWPAFWMAAPLLLKRHLHPTPRDFRILMVLHVVLLWTPWVVESFRWEQSLGYPPFLALAFLLQICGFEIARHRLNAPVMTG